MGEELFENKGLNNDEERRDGNASSDNNNHSERPRFVRRERVGNENVYRPRYNGGYGENRNYSRPTNNRYNNYSNHGSNYNAGGYVGGNRDVDGEMRPNRPYRPRFAQNGNENYQRPNRYVCFSVVARMKMACRGGSSSVFRKALKAEADSMCTSSMM